MQLSTTLQISTPKTGRTNPRKPLRWSELWWNTRQDFLKIYQAFEKLLLKPSKDASQKPSLISWSRFPPCTCKGWANNHLTTTGHSCKVMGTMPWWLLVPRLVSTSGDTSFMHAEEMTKRQPINRTYQWLQNNTKLSESRADEMSTYRRHQLP